MPSCQLNRRKTDTLNMLGVFNLLSSCAHNRWTNLSPTTAIALRRSLTLDSFKADNSDDSQLDETKYVAPS